MAELTSAQVWREIARANFMVIGMVSARGAARTSGVMHHVHDGVIWFTTNEREWKYRHLTANPSVSVTVPLARRVWFLPWIKVPAATITFSGRATVVPAAEMPSAVREVLVRGLELADEGERGALVGVGIHAVGDFVTYGVGVSTLAMRDTEKARGRVSAGLA